MPGHEFSPLTVYAGLAMNTKEELTDQYISYINTIKKLKDKPGLSAAVYTQISDVEYEINGLLSYDRKVEKVDFARVAAAHRELIGSSNKSDLLTSIQAAKQIRDNAAVGDGPGQYKQQVVNLFSAAIANAQAAYDNEQTTADGIKTAIAALDTAIKQFRDKANNPLPFMDTFDDLNAEGWTTYGGEWSAASGKYTVINGEGYKAVAKETKFQDFTYETDISMSASPNLANAGVIFRVNNPTVGADNLQGYYAGITLAGRVQLGKLNNNWTELANKAAPPISVDTVYRLKVVAKGPNIDVYVNDTLVASAVDSTFTEGAIGLRTYKANATFDNIRVAEMEDAVQPNMTLDGTSLVNEGSTFAVKLGVSSVTNTVYGSDVTLKYQADLFELQQVDSAAEGIAVVHYVDDHNGSVRMVLANIGGDDRSKHETPLVTLQFKAKGSPNSAGNIAVLKAVLADEKGTETEALPAELTVRIEGYVSDGDLNHDSKYSIGDLAILATHYGKNSSSPDWNVARAADLTGDGKVDIEDLAKMAQKVLNQ